MSTSGLVGLLENAQCIIRASSCADGITIPNNMRIQNSDEHNSSNAWYPYESTAHQNIVFGCENPRTFKAVSIQGDLDNYISSYKLSYSLDNVKWVEYNNGTSINGCCNGNEIKTTFFSTPFRARSIKLIPLTWNNQIALRIEVYTDPIINTFIQTGKISSGADGNLNKGSGDREIKVSVKYPIPFSKIPKVTLGFNYLDGTAPNQFRASAVAKDITETGFNVVYSTWSSSFMYRIDCDYIATCDE